MSLEPMDIWTLGLLSFSLQEGTENLATGRGFIKRPVLPRPRPEHALHTRKHGEEEPSALQLQLHSDSKWINIVIH
jgi:hypothetical protein